jgi:hypothetical protein
MMMQERLLFGAHKMADVFRDQLLDLGIPMAAVASSELVAFCNFYEIVRAACVQHTGASAVVVDARATVLLRADADEPASAGAVQPRSAEPEAAFAAARHELLLGGGAREARVGRVWWAF